MADQKESTQELLLDVRVAEASRFYKFYLNQEKKILGTASVFIFLVIWELVGNTLQLINHMFMSAPSLIWKAGVQLFTSGEIYNDLYISGVELFWGYFLSAAFAVRRPAARPPNLSGRNSRWRGCPASSARGAARK